MIINKRELNAFTHNFFTTLKEPQQSVLLFLRNFLIEQCGLSESWKNNTPFYYYQKKWFAFISYNPKDDEIYVSFVKGFQISHPALKSEGRKQQKIYRIDPENDVDVNELNSIIKALKGKY